MSIVLPEDYKFVIASLALVPAFGIYVGHSVGTTRKWSNVALPALFATEEDAAKDPKKKIFNCTQKSAMNFHEHMPIFVIASVIAGLFNPRAVAILNLTWLTGRLLFHIGYSSGDPEKRKIGLSASVAQAALTGMAIYSTVKAAFF